MTDKIEWGAEIPVNGVRPDWLRDDQIISVLWSCNGVRTHGSEARLFLYRQWADGAIFSFRLPADHPAYTVLEWNEAHPGEEPFVPWCGGDEAPGDWDGVSALNRRCRINNSPVSWQHPWQGIGEKDDPSDIIGYRRRKEPASEPVVPPGYVLVKQMTREEACAWLNDKKPGWYSLYQTLLMLLELQGAILPDPDPLDAIFAALPAKTIARADGSKAFREELAKHGLKIVEA